MSAARISAQADQTVGSRRRFAKSFVRCTPRRSSAGSRLALVAAAAVVAGGCGGAERIETTAATVIGADVEETGGTGRFRPTDVQLFHPLYYPRSRLLPPASGPRPGEARTLRLLRAFLARRDPSREREAVRLFRAPAVVERVPDASLRAALVSLLGTSAEPAIGFVVASGRFTKVVFGDPPGDVVARSVDEGTGKQTIVVDRRFRFEHFLLLSPVLAHEGLHSDASASDVEELAATAFQALVHMEQLVTEPRLGAQRTRLAQHLNPWVLARLNSRPEGSLELRLVLPGDAPTILPGGVDRPHFASFFDPTDPPTAGNRYLEAALAALAGPGASVPRRPRFDLATIRFLDENQQALEPEELLEVARSLRLVSS